MHLLNTSSLELEYFGGRKIPPYAILSHRWQNEEVTFQDVQSGNASKKAGYEKLEGTCTLAKSHGFEYAWIDTCCIDKSSSAELSEAINSMFLWYQEATVCYVYLADVPHESENDSIISNASFQRSKWFTRGWTLQELLAPAMVIFLDQTWSEIGTKTSLASTISLITTIPTPVLCGTRSIDEISIATKMSWAAYRETARAEDIAYCLLGIFNVNMPIMYGERERAFMRLQEEIFKITDDHSIFAWHHREGFHPRYSKTGTSMQFAYFPFEFLRDPGEITTDEDADLGLHHDWECQDDTPLFDKSIFVDNQGIHLRLPLFQMGKALEGDVVSQNADTWLILPCRMTIADGEKRLIGISLIREGSGVYIRKGCRLMRAEELRPCTPIREKNGKMCIKRVHPVRQQAVQLIDAARSGNTTEVRFLLARGIQDDSVYPVQEDHLQKTMWASPRLTALQKNGLRPSALACAIWWGHEGAVKELLNRPTGKEQLLGPSGEGLLTLPAMVENVRMVELLLDHGANKPEWSGPVLGDAAEWGNKNVAKLLLKRNADPNAVVSWKAGRTPLSIAAERGHAVVMELLIENGADVEARDENGRVPLSWAVFSRGGGVVEVLLRRGARCDVRDNHGRTPLSWAAQYGNQGAVEQLFPPRGVEFEKDLEGLSPLDYAYRYGNKGIVRLFLDSDYKGIVNISDEARKGMDEWAGSGAENVEWKKIRKPRAVSQIVTARRRGWLQRLNIE
jgi:hypothetical protein